MNRPETDPDFSYDIVVCCAGADAELATRIAEKLEERHAFKVAFYRDGKSKVFFFGTVLGNSIDAVDSSSLVIFIISDNTDYRRSVVGDEFLRATDGEKPLAVICKGPPLGDWKDKFAALDIAYNEVPINDLADEELDVLCDRIEIAFSRPRNQLKRISERNSNLSTKGAVIDIYSDEFFGRDADIEHAKTLLEQNQIVSLIAGPCLGKTRFAHEAALAQDLPVRKVDFSAAISLEDLANEVSDKLGFPLAGQRDEGAEKGEQLQIRVGRALSEFGPLLVILDEFENAVANAPKALSIWCHHAPEAKFLATSRIALGDLRQEGIKPPKAVEFHLEPLEGPSRDAIDQRKRAEIASAPAMELLLERLGKPDVADDDFFVLAELCFRLAGFPAPIEALSRLLREGAITANDLLEDESRLSKVAFEGIAESDGHRHLFPMLDQTCSSLTRDCITCWAQSAMFADGLKFDSAEAIFLSGESDAISIYRTLHKWGILRLDKSSGRSVLYRPYQEYALCKLKAWLTSDEQRAHRKRYLAYFANATKKKYSTLLTSEVRSALNWFRDERDNIRVAVEQGIEDGCYEDVARLVISLDISFFVDGPAGGYKVLLDSVLARRSELSEQSVAELLVRKSRTIWSLGNYNQSLVVAHEAVKLSAAFSADGKRTLLEARAWLSSLRETSDGYTTEEVERECRDLLEQFESIDDYRGVDYVARSLVSIYDRHARIDEVDKLIQLNLNSSRPRDPYTHSRLLNNIGVLRWHNGQPHEAIQFLKKAEAINLKNQDDLLLAGNYTNIALANLDLEEFSLAESYLGEAYKLHRQSGNLGWLAVNYVARCRYFLFRNEFDLALNFCNRFRKIVYDVDYKENQALFDVIEAEASYFHLGVNDSTVKLVKAARARLSKQSPRLRRYYVAAALEALCDAETGNVASAQTALSDVRTVSALRKIDETHQSGYYRNWHRRVTAFENSLLEQ